jgi:hypothetical protein
MQLNNKVLENITDLNEALNQDIIDKEVDISLLPKTEGFVPEVLKIKPIRK